MTLTNLLIFAGVYFVAVATHGPGIALIIARSLGRGLGGLPWFVAGFTLGDLVLMTLAVLGLATIAHTFETAFQILRYLGAAYLLWMAWKIFNSPAQSLEITADAQVESPLAAFMSSFTLCLGNPKPIIFFLSIMPLVVDIEKIDLTIYLELATIVILVIAPVLALIAILADRARRLFKSKRALNRINKGTAVVMAGAAIAIAAR